MFEIVLEKYTAAPKHLILSDNGMLECCGIVIAQDVLLFDAATDISGNIHGVFFNNGGEIVYFMLGDKAPVNKVMAICVLQKNLKYISVDERDGIVHIIIVKNDKLPTLYHYFTSNNDWVRAAPKQLEDCKAVFSSCICDDNGIAVLTENKNTYQLYFNEKDNWYSENIVFPDAFDDIGMAFLDRSIEIITRQGAEYNIQKISVEKFFESIRIASKINSEKEYAMANGNTINSKFILQLQENTETIKNLNTRNSEIQRELESIRQMLESQQASFRTMSSYRDTMRQYETQINHIGIKLQELSNRLNGIAKQGKQQ